MPIYEYICNNCGERFDFFAKRISQAPDACPKCGAKTLDKCLSTFNAKVGAGRSVPPPAACPTGTCCPGGTCTL